MGPVAKKPWIRLGFEGSDAEWKKEFEELKQECAWEAMVLRFFWRWNSLNFICIN